MLERHTAESHPAQRLALLLTLSLLALGACGTDRTTTEAGTSDAAEAPEVTDTSGEIDRPDVDSDASDDTPGVTFEPVPITADASFFELFRHDRVHPVTVRMTRDAWDGLVAEMLDYAALDGLMRTGRYHHADFVYTAPDGTEEVVEDVGFRTRGNTTRVVPQDVDGAYHRAHFKVRFNATFDLPAGSPAEEARNARRFRTLRALNLKWSAEDDPSKIRELYAYDLLRRAGVSAPLTAPVALTLEIDGTPVYYGLYTAIEEIDKGFLAKRRGKDGNDGDLYKCLWQDYGPATLEPVTDPHAIGVKDWTTNYRPAYDLQTNESTSDHAALRAFIARLHDTHGEQLAAELAATFDVERFLRALAMNVLIGMPDDYWAMGNNYFLYFDAAGGLTEFIPYDYDHGFGGGWEPTPEWSYEGIATADVHTWKNLNAAWWNPHTTHPLADGLLAVPAVRARYDAILAALVAPDTGLFDYADYARVFAAQSALYAPWLPNDTGEDEHMEDDGQAAWYFATKRASVGAQLGLDLPTADR
ncbi:MAG: hypothetical protein EP329_16425 [Deltaproteobacteria bacterium]|nr:MAG: hypothetical protein EP329_16425 [Deltaproteobacteria bacterium]